MPGDGERARGRRQNAAEDGQKRGLAAARRSHQQGELAGTQRQIDALERAHLAGPLAQVLDDVARLQHDPGNPDGLGAGLVGDREVAAVGGHRLHVDAELGRFIGLQDFR